MELRGPLCCESGGCVPLLVGSRAVQGDSRGRCGSSSRGQCVSAWVFFWGVLWLSTTGMKFSASRKMGCWLCLYPALRPQLPCHPLIWDFPSSATLNSPLRCGRPQCVRQQCWGLPHRPPPHAQLGQGSPQKASQRLAKARLVAPPGWRCEGKLWSPGRGFVIVCGDNPKSLIPHASQADERCCNQRLPGKSFNPIINFSKSFSQGMKPNKKGTDLLGENRSMERVLHLSINGKTVAAGSCPPRACCSPQEGNYGACLLQG